MASSNYKAVVISKPEPGILQLMLSRPESRNAMTGDMIKEIVEVLNKASSDPTVRCVVVTGDPRGKAFCTGADLSAQVNNFGTNPEGSVPDSTAESFRDPGGYTTFAAINCRKPIITALNGSAVGWGLAFPCATDIRVASETGKYGFTMVARG